MNEEKTLEELIEYILEQEKIIDEKELQIQILTSRVSHLEEIISEFDKDLMS